MQERKFYVAGVQHHQLSKIINQLIEGEELDLVAEPENKFDPNAVKIMYENTMLGYVPKRLSAEVAALLEAGVNVACTIETLTPENKPWEQLEVLIHEDSEENYEDDEEFEDEDSFEDLYPSEGDED